MNGSFRLLLPRDRTRYIFFMFMCVFPEGYSPAQFLTFTGMCHASAAVALDSSHFIVGDDEENILRIYDRRAPGPPLQSIRLSDVFPGEVHDGEDMEIDIEGTARLGDMMFWIGSHGTSRKGHYRPERHRLLAVNIVSHPSGTFNACRAGRIYATLIEDLANDRRYREWNLRKAMTIPSKEAGGLNIEGLAATPSGTLLIGFRNPLRNGTTGAAKTALLAPLLNPMEVVSGTRARFGEPVALDLGGRGIRSIEWWKDDDYLIVAGPPQGSDARDLGRQEQRARDRESARLYAWKRSTNIVRVLPNKIPLGLNAEAAFFFPQDKGCTVQLLSDDGGQDCRDRFRYLTEKLDAR